MQPAYTEFGDRANPSILFLHGIRLGRDIWTRHARALVDRFHVVTLDLPGHGALADQPFVTARITALLDEVTTRVCASPPIVVGYSLGGYVMMSYATVYPERTAGLVLAGCTLDLDGWKLWPYAASARVAEWLPAAWLDRTLQMTLHMVLPKAWVEIVQAIPFNPEVLAQTSQLARGAHFSEMLARYRKPVSFVNGEYDLVFRLDERRFLERVSQGHARIIRHADHTAPLRHAEEFTTIVRDFAQGAFATSAGRT